MHQVTSNNEEYQGLKKHGLKGFTLQDGSNYISLTKEGEKRKPVLNCEIFLKPFYLYLRDIGQINLVVEEYGSPEERGQNMNRLNLITLGNKDIVKSHNFIKNSVLIPQFEELNKILLLSFSEMKVQELPYIS